MRRQPELLSLEEPPRLRTGVMMTAGEYRARAEALEASADACANSPLMLHMVAGAQAWRRLSEIADWQDAMLAALAAAGEGPAS